MQFAEIDAFLAVIRTGSISNAAEQLFITQPTLSQRIKSLETEINAQLFLRTKGQRQVVLTEAGRALIPIAEKLHQLREEATHISNTTSQPVFRIAATQTLSTYVMPSAYSSFLKRGLPVAMELYSLHYRECYESIENGSIDAVFVSRTMSSSRVSSIQVASERMVLLCSKKSPYSGPVHPSQLPVNKGIYMMWNHEYAMWHEYWFGLRQSPITADNMRLVEQILVTSDMWAIVPISAAISVCKSSPVHYFELQDAPPERPIYLLTLEPQHECTKYIVDDLCKYMKKVTSSNKA